MRTRRLGVCPQSIGSYQWGGNAKLALTDDPTYNTVVVPGIPNLSMDWNEIPASRILDLENHAFVNHESETIYRAGFMASPGTIGLINKDEIVPLGKLDTARIIAHRNKILRDSGINLPVPIASALESEKSCLERLISSANTSPGRGYQYYYPAASYCYAYEPTVKAGEILTDKFRARQWFLPTTGDMMRFGQAYKIGWLDAIKPYSWPNPLSYASTTVQYDSTARFLIYLADGQIFRQTTGNCGKVEYFHVFPMVQF